MSEPGGPQLGGLFVGFEGQRVATDDELTTGIGSALISLDANVLLGLYRFPDEFNTALLEALEVMSDRVFVSNQALAEFWRNRTSALADRRRAKLEVEKQLRSAENSVSTAISAWAKKTAIDDSDLQQTRELIERHFEVLLKVVEDNHREDAETYPSPRLDPIVQSLETLLDGKVGARPSQDEFDTLVTEGKRRHAQQQPPGYKEKEADKHHLPEGVAGDYLVWMQSIAEAKRRDLDLLLITSDTKEDWFWRAGASVIGPRQELTKEFWDAAGRRLLMATPITFMQAYQTVGGDVSEHALAEAAGTLVPAPEPTDLREDDAPSWTALSVEQVLRRLDSEAPVQAATIRAAAANGGVVGREHVFAIGRYGPKRMLRGFTRPVRRVSRLLQEAGHLSLEAPDLLRPRYDYYGLAEAFVVPDEVVDILAERDGGRPSLPQ